MIGEWRMLKNFHFFKEIMKLGTDEIKWRKNIKLAKCNWLRKEVKLFVIKY